MRERATLDDHTGELTARVTLRITDRGNGTAARRRRRAGDGHGHPARHSGPVRRDPGGAGATCATSTTVEALIPGAVAEGRRAVWELGRCEVLGPDERPFLRQGIFAPDL